MQIVIVESPYGHPNKDVVAFHERYLSACLRDSLLRGEAPYASHAIYTRPGVLDDQNPEERRHGMQAGFAFRDVATKTVVYEDLIISSGMQAGIADAEAKGRPIERRRLGGTWPERYALILELAAGSVG